MKSFYFVFLSVLIFALFSITIGQSNNNEETEENVNTAARILEGLTGFPGIDPALFLFSQLFTESDISLECLLALSPLFGQNSLFPVLNLNNFFSQTNTLSSFPFGIPIKTLEVVANYHEFWVYVTTLVIAIPLLFYFFFICFLPTAEISIHFLMHHLQVFVQIT